MTNPYYNPTGTPGTGAAGASSPIRSEFASIAAGFSSLPTFSGGSAGQTLIVNTSGTALVTTSALVFDSSGNATHTNNLTMSGTNAVLNFSSTGQRLTGDFSNATIASRLLLQTATAGGSTSVGAIPNGAGTTAGFTAYNAATPTNSSLGAVQATSTAIVFNSSAAGTGTVLPLDLQISSSTKLRVSTAGNVLIGTTTDASTGALQVTGNASVSGSVTAASFVGAGTGLTGTAASLSIGGNAATATSATSATTATTANALNTGNSYQVNALGINVAAPGFAGGLAAAGGAYTPLVTVASVGAGTATFNLQLGNSFRYVLNGATTIAMSNPNSGQSGCIRLKQDGTGNRVVTWPGTFRWGSGAVPVLSTAANAEDYLSWQYDSTDATYVCSLLKGVQ